VTSQAADASGLTSAKDVMPSGERLREPLPCQGLKELINVAQGAMQSPNLRAACTPASSWNRAAASPGIMDKKLIYLTPMPLHSSSLPAGSFGRKLPSIHEDKRVVFSKHKETRFPRGNPRIAL